MATHLITAVRKAHKESSVEHITHVKFGNSIHTTEEVIHLIKESDLFYVDNLDSLAWVEVVYPGSHQLPYIKSRPDSTGKDYLLALPEC